MFLSGVTNFTIENSQFINNYGSAIRAIDVLLPSETTKLTEGEPCTLLLNSVVSLDMDTTIYFHENSAIDVGGAVYTDQFDQKTQKITRCFYHFFTLDENMWGFLLFYLLYHGIYQQFRYKWRRGHLWICRHHLFSA